MEPSPHKNPLRWLLSENIADVSIQPLDKAAGTFELDIVTRNGAREDSFHLMITRERAEELREMLDVVLRHRPAWAAETKRLNQAHVKLFIGDEVVDVDGNKGIVVKIERPADDDHGINFEDTAMVYVWQSEEPLNYGYDNCRQYPLEDWRSLLRIMKP